MPQKLIIDADPGVSDALTIARALSDPEFDVVGLTAVGGRVTVSQACRNLMALLEAVDPPKFPRLGVADAQDADFERARFSEHFVEDNELDRRLQGESGLGGWPVGDTELHHPRSAAKVMVELTREFPGEVTILTLGPLTNVAMAVDLDPEFPARLKGLMAYGGTLDGPGDITPAAEFNLCYNPDAARRVLHSSITKTLFPLNVARKGVLTFDRVRKLCEGRTDSYGKLVNSLLSFALRAQHEQLGMEGMWLHELATLAALGRPQLFTHQSWGIEVETSNSLSRGACLLDRRPRPRWRANIEVVTDFDTTAVLDYICAGFSS